MKAREFIRKVSKSAWIINGFALLHAVTTIVCRLIGVDDSLVLTLMTMLMTVLLCLVRGCSPEISAACVILVNVLGLILGTYIAKLLFLMTVSQLVTYSLSTFLTTEILGWSIVLLTKLFRASGSKINWSTSVKWLTTAFVVIIVLRFGYVESFSYFYDSTEVFIDSITGLLSNILAMLVTICANIVYVRGIGNWHASQVWKVPVLILFIVAISMTVTLMDVYNVPTVIHRGPVDTREFFGIFMLALILELTVYSIVYIINYALAADRAREEARLRAQEVQFQYTKLKTQISPHFFFNSLNSLDCLVCDGKDSLASEYIHKLAGIYRYMLVRGEEEFVKLRDEMTFVDMYVDLMGLRYGTGLVVRTSIGEEVMGRLVVPCAVQLLIENAVKHNVVSEDEPMEVEISAEGDAITVRNALRPRLTPSNEGGGHGLTYIRKLYESLSDRPVLIRQTDTEYIVTLPLI
ncbi:MAG: histidine kinase [Bacteroidales bacterium]|nr:histidine kinase [Bacteroidales bacterium]